MDRRAHIQHSTGFITTCVDVGALNLTKVSKEGLTEMYLSNGLYVCEIKLLAVSIYRSRHVCVLQCVQSEDGSLSLFGVHQLVQYACWHTGTHWQSCHAPANAINCIDELVRTGTNRCATIKANPSAFNIYFTSHCI